jgi:hypothetical protein
MKCNKCGKELKENDKFCPECGQVVNEIKEEVKEEIKKEEVKPQEPVIEEKRIVSGMKNDTFFCVLSLIFYIGGPALSKLFLMFKSYSSIFETIANITRLFPLIGFGLVIYAKVKYPKSKFAKTLLIIYIILFAIAIVYIIIVVVACYLILKDCSNSSLGFILN